MIAGLAIAESDQLDDSKMERIADYIVSKKNTCTLDLAERGPSTLNEIGDSFGVTRERVRQIESAGIKKISSCDAGHGILEEMFKSSLEER